jgi:hypothetical protein
VVVRVQIQDDDAGCGSGRDTFDVNPLRGQANARLRVQLDTGAVFLLNANDTDAFQLGFVGMPLSLTGDGSDADDRATITFMINRQPIM